MTVVNLQESVKDKQIRELQEKLAVYEQEEKLEEYASQISRATNAILLTWVVARQEEDFKIMCQKLDDLLVKLQPFLKDEDDQDN
jgi:hypothetical protein